MRECMRDIFVFLSLYTVIFSSGKNKDRLVKTYRGVMEFLSEYRDYIDSLKGSEDRLFWKEVSHTICSYISLHCSIFRSIVTPITD